MWKHEPRDQVCQVGSCREGEGMCWPLSRQDSRAVVLVVIESLIILCLNQGVDHRFFWAKLNDEDHGTGIQYTMVINGL